jgi:NADPH2:quinone reductase
LPADVDQGKASALPVAGVTALRALRRLGPVVGRRVLVTGASGGVGRFAVQLARRAGAHVVASVGAAGRGDGLLSLGAHDVLVGLDAVAEPVHGVLENVGGSTLVRAFELVALGGGLVSIGVASLEPSVLEQERVRGGDRRIEVFSVGPGFGPELSYLVGLFAAGELDVPIGWRSSWQRATEAADALLERRVHGKAVLELRAAVQ